jgi:hypothetical protein
LELKSSLVPDFAAIRVVIVPVDVVPPAVLHKYTAIIEAQVRNATTTTTRPIDSSFDRLLPFTNTHTRTHTQADIELRQLTQPPSRGAHHEELTSKRPWHEARVRFTFVDAAQHHPSPWTELHVHRRVLGVIGVFHCRSGDSSLAHAATQFADVLRRYPSALASTCFAFEPLDEQPDLDSSSAPGRNVILIPNTDTADKLAFYLSTLVQDFTARMLAQLDAFVDVYERAPHIATPLDAAKTADEIAKLKKRKPARLAKLKADIALLLGSPDNALDWFAAAIEQNRAAGDQLWLAAALEGAAVAAVVQQTRWLTQPVAEATYALVLDRCREALALYRKRGDTVLELELTVRLARFVAASPLQRDATNELIYALQTHLAAVEGLSSRNRTILATGLAQISAQMGRTRAAAAHARTAASAAASANQAHTALALMRLASRGAQIAVDAPLPLAAPPLPEKAVQSTRVAHRYAPVAKRHCLALGLRFGWAPVQSAMLSDLSMLARQSHDAVAASHYAVALLAHVGPLLGAQTQQRILDTILSVTSVRFFPFVFAPSSPLSPPSNIVDMTNLPIVERVVPLSLPLHLRPVSTTQKAREKDVFIVSPFNKSNKAADDKPVFVADTIVSVRVLLTNPLDIPLQLDSIELSVYGAPLKTMPRAIELPRRAASFPVVLHGIARHGPRSVEATAAATGGALPPDASMLFVRGVHISMCGITSEHVVSPWGNGVPPETFVRIEKDVYSRAAVAAAPPPMMVPLLPPLPLVELFVVGAPHGRLASAAPPFALIVGERATALLHVRNTGAMPIGSLRLSLQGSSNVDPPPPSPVMIDDVLAPPVEWDDAAIAAALPLAPGAELCVSLALRGRPWHNGGDLLLMYACDADASYCRHAMVPLPLQVYPGVRVTAYAAHAIPERPDWVALQYTLHNASPRSVLIDVGVAERVAVPDGAVQVPLHGLSMNPGSQRSVALAVRRLPLDVAALPPMREFDPNSKQFDRSLLKLTKRQLVALRLREAATYELLTSVRLTWRGSRSAASSQGDVDCTAVGQQQTPAALSALVASRARLRVRCEREPVAIGALHDIAVVLDAADALPPLTMDVRLELDAAGAAIALDECVVIGGQLGDIAVPAVGAARSDAFQHTLQVAFVRAGTYRLTVRCVGVPIDAYAVQEAAGDAEASVVWCQLVERIVVVAARQ